MLGTITAKSFSYVARDITARCFKFRVTLRETVLLATPAFIAAREIVIPAAFSARWICCSYVSKSFMLSV